MDIMNALRAVSERTKQWTEDKLGQKVDKSGNKKLTDENYSTAEKTKVSNMATGLAVIDGKLYLKNDDGLITESATTLPAGGGGGTGGGSSASITLNNLLDSNSITVAVGGNANLRFEYSSSETNAQGTAYVYVGGNLKKTYTIVTGENTINVGELLNEGVNDIKVTCSDIYSNTKSLSYVVNAITLKLTSNFDDSQIFTGDVPIRYTPYGAISKDVHLVINGKDTVVTTISETGKQQTFTITSSQLPHGAHDLELYLSTTIDGYTVTSNRLYYSIIVTEQNVTIPVISSVSAYNKITQGEAAQISYIVYDPVSTNTQVSLIVKQGDEVYSSITRTVDATKQTWITRDLPVGDVTLIIKYGTIERYHEINVQPSDITLNIKNTDLEFYLKSDGKSNEDENRDIWENNGVSTLFEYVNYKSTGWVDTSDGTALRLSGDAKATIQFQPFASDARQTGRTIELDFAIRDVNNRDAIAIDCMYGGVGFSVSADTAFISSEQTKVSCNYTDEEVIHVSFVIEPRSEYKLMSVYLNGILSGVKQYPETDNLQQNVPQYITIGSPYCCIDLYSIRSYNTALTADEVRGNYIASIVDVSEKLAVYEDNNIYDMYGNLSFDALKDKIPTMVITGILPTYKGDKKKVSVSFAHPEKPSLNYEDSATIDVQGTSSSLYIRKNWKIKMSGYHQIDVDKIPTKVICTKADYAESTGSRNTAGANYVDTLYGDAKVPPQNNDDKIRTTIYGYPCVLYHRETTSDIPQFVGRYNYNYDKSSVEAFGFTDDYPDAMSVEFCNNTSDQCLFHGEITDGFGDNFEYRYPDEYGDISDFKNMHDWVVSTYRDNATENELPSSYTGLDETVYTHDTAEYRLAKFKKEFTDHFNMDFALIYYVYTYFALLVDSRAKNLFLTTFDRQHWYCYFYDMDTSYGINNEGVLVLNPFMEDDDTLDNANIYNGQTSTLWNNFKDAFPNEIQACYKELRGNNLLSYDKIVEHYITKQTNKWSISIYNEDADYKYISMLRENNDASNLYQVRGSGESHLRYFVKNRVNYCDSLWNCGKYPDNFASLRIYTPTTNNLVVEPNANITITPYSDMYPGVKYKANGTLQQQRAKANVPITFVAPTETYNDTETAIYGASEISSLGDLSPLYCGTVNLSKATKLTEVIVGNGTSGYVNTNLKELAVGTNKLLKKVDIQNCPNLIHPLALSQCPNIQEIYAQGSGITGVELPDSGYLKKVYLPNTIANLTVTNQEYIEEFSLDGYDNLTTLRIENAVNIPVEDIMINAPKLNRIRLIDVVWHADSEEALQQVIDKFMNCLGLDASNNNTDKAVVTGRVTVPSISNELYNTIYENFPGLVVDDGSGKIYIVNYMDRDGNSLYVARLSEGEDAFDPIASGDITRPDDIITSDVIYEFAGWSSMPTNVNSHHKITPVYKTKYAVKFYSNDVLIESATQWVYQGGAASDPLLWGNPIEVPTKPGSDDLQYAFGGWSNMPINIQRPTRVDAVFNNLHPVKYYSDNDGIEPYYIQWVIENGDAHDPITGEEQLEPPTKLGTTDMRYVFESWDNIPKNVQSIQSVYATYSKQWAVRFWNENVVINTQWIKTGDNAVDPITLGYTTPIKESTPEWDYIFLNWSGDYTSIVGPTRIEAIFGATPRTYTVRFYNMDTLLQTVEDVQYGASVSYTGETPIKKGVSDADKYTFVGWDPAPTEISGNTDCYALFRYNGYLTDDWDVIAENVENGTAIDKYPIGARKELTFTLLDGNTITADMEIVGYNHDDLADDSGKATLTFLCNTIPDLYNIMAASNTSGWEYSEMRAFTNNTLFNAFPGALKDAIKPVYKISDGGESKKALVTTVDKCWIPSYNEIGFTNGFYNLSGQGEIYGSTFNNGDSGNSTRRRYLANGHIPFGWWTRTSYYSPNSVMFYRVTSSGGAYPDGPNGKWGVIFGFCI